MMPVLLILMVMLALWSPDPLRAEPLLGLGPWWSTGLMLFGLALVWLAAEIPTRLILWQLRRQPSERSSCIRAYHRWRGIHLGFTCLVYAGSLLLADWGYTVRIDWQLHSAVLVDELLALAPLIVALILGWASFYSAEYRFYATSNVAAAIPFWSRWAFVVFHVRHHLGLVLVPVLAFTGLHELVRWLFPVIERVDQYHLGALGVLGLVILIITPWLLTWIWSARALPPGPLRERLEAAARRIRFRYTDILLWNTRGGVANAMVTGLLPFPRYILLSDCLVQNLTVEEVEGVFGHEIGHIRHHHMPLYLLFFVLSVSLLMMCTAIVCDWFGLTPDDFELSWGALRGDRAVSLATAAIGTLSLVGGYIYLVFGFLSRRCERQADVYGCKMVSCGDPQCTGHDLGREGVGALGREGVGALGREGVGALGREGENDNTAMPRVLPALTLPLAHALTSSRPHAPTLSRRHPLTLCPTGIRTFISALDKVADLNGIPRGKPSWRHASIARRVQFLENLASDLSGEPQFQRRLLWTKLGLLALLTLIVGALWYHVEHSVEPPAGSSPSSPAARG